MSLFYKHEWDEENKELTLYINQTVAFSEFASELLPRNLKNNNAKNTLLEAAKEYVQTNIGSFNQISTYRIKFQNFLVAVLPKNKVANSNETTGNNESFQYTDYVYYIVQDSEKLKEICNLLNVKEETIRAYNGLTEDNISSGMKLKIPVYHHTVVTADSLHRIAQKYNVSKESIRVINNFSTDCLSLGQQIVIPKPI
ncbi:LysM peptidoglycan-binding domain-containing protein [Sutcliffiella cohnii]|uniref:LysM domain-containing protein n=1 Tax=Sutcliffiella cohnii TaxID=33932 RepID=A0A223KQ85_9BACI|nr:MULTISPECIES: LysM peptidoglycan-binding domain-containing protein [Sutcliffiella]AST91576.1 hypothetical protein BC6307_09915 [Sutcliffiella cohnii]MED4014849.1 LysM peptidoglycan-binding domain-containing protein [Sutcliffiella cohnii]WBL17408.1 LysM peptidoglycan-binding domain-containing protein [Sutcliffiella sp. NC1]